MQRLDIEEDRLYLNPNGNRRGRSSGFRVQHKQLWFLLMWGIGLIVGVILLVSFMGNGDENGGSASTIQDSTSHQYVIETKHAIVATDDERCSQLGINTLEKGGNAVDAALVALLCEDIANPASSGVGGGFLFSLFSPSSPNGTFVDARERAPGLANASFFEADPTLTQDGALAIATPGFLKGLEHLSSQYGNLSFAALFDEIIPLAEASSLNSFTASVLAANPSYCSSYPTLSSTFCESADTPKQEGDTISRPALAAFLAALQANGSSDPFYKGSWGASFVQDIQNDGGILSEEDLRLYEVEEKAMLVEDVLGHRMLFPPLISSGGYTAISILKLLERARKNKPIAGMGELYHHLLAEAYKHAFALRMNLGDEAFVNFSASSVLEDMRDERFLSTLSINETGVLSDYYAYGGEYNVYAANEDQVEGKVERAIVFKDDHGTSHISVYDRKSNTAVSVTSTINTYFGSKIISPSTGVICNNEMDDFSLRNSSNAFGLAPFAANYIEPYKRPLSSMTPTIVLQEREGSDGSIFDFKLAIGASGGPHIITATVQNILHLLAFGKDVYDSLVTPRIHHQYSPDLLYVEDNTAIEEDGVDTLYVALDSTTRSYLRNTSQPLFSYAQDGSNSQLSFGICQMITEFRHPVELEGGSDPRKGGVPEGY